MPNRYIFEFEVAAEPRRIRLSIDSLRLTRNVGLDDLLNTGGSDTNVAQYIATMREFYREKFKFLGALFEMDAGMNIKAWISKGDNIISDTVYVPQPLTGKFEATPRLYSTNENIEFSTGPSLKLRISSGRDRGEAVLSVICNVELNYYFSNKRPQ